MLKEEKLRRIEQELGKVSCEYCGGDTVVKIKGCKGVVSYDIKHDCERHREYLERELKRLLFS